MSLKDDKKWLLQEKYNGLAAEGFFNDCAKLEAGEPLAYLIGHVPFLHTNIYLDSRPLIPRTETEFWTEYLISYYRKQKSSPRNILDLCAGSGCIGIALAEAFPTAHVTFVEIDTTHHSTIKKNCQLNRISDDRYTIIGGNLFADLTDQRFELIVSNPPYIDPKLDRTETSVKNYEPTLALYGGNEGLEILREIVAKAAKYLKPQGEVWLEHEPEQALALAQLVKNSFKLHTHKDQYRALRFSQLVLQ